MQKQKNIGSVACCIATVDTIPFPKGHRLSFALVLVLSCRIPHASTTSSSSSSPRRAILSTEPLRGGRFRTPSPFLFAVHHNDAYPAGDGQMRAPRRGNGADFDSSRPWKMYHGDRIPGFPQHPHRGFETITATMTGFIDHSDSHGNAGRRSMAPHTR